MGTGLNCSPVIACGDHNRINPVHDAFIVGGGPIGIDNGQRAGFDNALGHALARKGFGFKRLGCQAYRSPRQTQIRQIGQNAQPHLAA